MNGFAILIGSCALAGIGACFGLAAVFAQLIGGAEVRYDAHYPAPKAEWVEPEWPVFQ